MEGNFEVESGGWREIQTLAVENRTTVRSGEQGRGRREALKRNRKKFFHILFLQTQLQTFCHSVNIFCTFDLSV